MIASAAGPAADGTTALAGGTTALAGVPVARIVRAIADAAERWRDGDFPPRVRALAAIAHRTGYAEPVAEYALDALFGAIDAAALTAALEAEVGDLAALDGAASGLPARAFRPAGRVAIVSSDTTIGVALFPLVFALAAKCDVVVKDRSDDLIAAFAETLREERGEFARALRVERWANGGGADARAVLASADVVVAFGGDAALRALRAECAPEARFVPFGHRTSLAYVEREALGEREADAVADGLARDALLYDGDGCLSPHAIFVERGGALEPEAFATRLAFAFERAAIEFPTSARAAEAVRARARSDAFRRAQPEFASSKSFRGAGDASLLLVAPPEGEPPPLAPGVVALCPVDGVDGVASYVARHAVPLEAAGLAAPGRARAEVRAGLLDCGVRRLAEIGQMQRPALGGPHGGVARVLPFLRYVWHD